ncbi:MAG: hypothetical protein QOE70_829 [Chthoniobacter sp.]|jgi:hypothetical protein|nr:hypothetical protein [Chthoniobacter sp.]
MQRSVVKLGTALAVLMASAAPLPADLTVVQKVEGGGQSGEQTIRIKDHKARCDVGGTISLIVDRQSGESFTLSHAQKGYLTISPERAKAMMEQMQKTRGSEEPPKLEDTGKREKIGEYQCEIFTADLGAVKVTYALAKDYPNYQSLLTQLDVLESGPLSATASGLAPRSKDLPGMPMKIIMEMTGQKISTTLLSASEAPVDPAIFNLPADYKELPSPPSPPPKP